MRSRSHSHYVDTRLLVVGGGHRVGAANRAARLLDRPLFFIETPFDENDADVQQDGSDKAQQCGTDEEKSKDSEAIHLPVPSIAALRATGKKTAQRTQWTDVLRRTKNMLQQRLGTLIQEGIAEGERFAISSDLWRCANPNSPKCDVLMTLRGPAPSRIEDGEERERCKKRALWLLDTLKRVAPELRIEVRYHQLTHSYGLYLSTSYVQLLKDAELCHLKKRLKGCFGGGSLKEFTLDEAQCFKGVEDRRHFLSSVERSALLKHRLDMIRTPSGGLLLTGGARMDGGVALVENLREAGIVDALLPLHDTEKLKRLQRTWVYAPLDEQPLEDIKDYFGHEIALYFAWLGHLTSALWVPAALGLLMSLFGSCLPSSTDSADDNSLLSDVCFVAFALFNCLWSTAYLESWKRRQAELAFKWGTYDGMMDSAVSVESNMALALSPRPSFKGDSVRPNPVTGRLEPTSSEWKQALVRYGVSYPITALVIAALFASLFALLRLQDVADSQFKSSPLTLWITYLPMILQALLILATENLYRHLALVLNDAENYRSDEEYENNLITKIAAFQCVSAFGSLFYIAFYLRDMRRLQEMLATLLITRQLTQNFMEVAMPYLMEKVRLCRLTYRLTKSISKESLKRQVKAVRRRRDTETTIAAKVGKGDALFVRESSNSKAGIKAPLNDTDSSQHWERGIFNWLRSSFRLSRSESRWGDTRLRRTNVSDANMQLLDKLSRSGSSANSVANKASSHRLPVPEFCLGPTTERRRDDERDLELTEAELQTLMSEYVRPLDDYLEMFIQFGYVLLFSPAFPPAALCALVNNLFEIRIDAFKLCNAMQRPFGRRVKSIGAWQTAMEMMGVVGVMVNCALIGQSGLVQRLWPNISLAAQLLIVVVLEHAILAAKTWIDRVIPDVPHHIRVEMAKVEHWRREAYRRETKLLANNNSHPADPFVGTAEISREPDRQETEGSLARANGHNHPSVADSMNARGDSESAVMAAPPMGTSDEEHEEAEALTSCRRRSSGGVRRLTNSLSAMFMSQRRGRNRSVTPTRKI